MRRVLVVRHGFSAANDRNNIGTPSFGHPDAKLMPLGIEQARKMGSKLRQTYAVEPVGTDVAVSQLQRTYETALYAGFDPRQIGRYATLNEITPGIPLKKIKAMIDKEIIPEVATFTALRILERPPVQPVWITSGFVITALTKELGLQNNYEFFIPKFGEIRDLEIR
jgi:phosphohistidine phosphatase SixA